MKITSILFLCVLVLAACQSPKSKAPAQAAILPATQNVQAPTRAESVAAASAVAVAEPIPQSEIKTPVPEVVAAAAPVVVVAKPKQLPELTEAEAIALAKKRGCYGCHTVHAKVYGPAWVDVAAKYRGDTGAQARLFDKIGKGGNGVWGSAAMPPQTQATEAERAQLIRFILNLK